jgi:hypothetical protein
MGSGAENDFVVHPDERSLRLNARAADREGTVGCLVLDYVYEVYQAINRIGGAQHMNASAES